MNIMNYEGLLANSDVDLPSKCYYLLAYPHRLAIILSNGTTAEDYTVKNLGIIGL